MVREEHETFDVRAWLRAAALRVFRGRVVQLVLVCAAESDTWGSLTLPLEAVSLLTHSTPSRVRGAIMELARLELLRGERAGAGAVKIQLTMPSHDSMWWLLGQLPSDPEDGDAPPGIRMD